MFEFRRILEEHLRQGNDLSYKKYTKNSLHDIEEIIIEVWDKKLKLIFDNSNLEDWETI